MTTPGALLSGKTALVLGGTGNVGYYLVDGFIRAGAEVLVVSRSAGNLDRLTARLGTDRAERISPIIGDIGTPEGARAVQAAVRDATARLDAVTVAAASWHQTPSMLQAGFEDFKRVIETRLYPHYLAAEALLPLVDSAGSYTTINGPAGFMPSPRQGLGPISVVSAAQDKLTRSFAAETDGHPRVNDLVLTVFIGPHGTRPGSPVSGEQAGDYVAALASAAGAGVHNRTLDLSRPEQVAEAVAGRFSDYRI
ncbi:SDR family oxidoreductase [Leifsonia sp. AG29]|uniref:SDR family oxidoreductase n=1 Tax=Leifsonia sp. AG29 TaxID=2598860 RepID=UPI00131ABD77|nr:SDR family oxidoreductase [Leifsonia sp. AG29]